MSNNTARIPATCDLLLGSLEIGLHRTVDRFAQEVGGGPQGRDTSRAYPGEALLQRLDKTPDRLASVVAEPHIPGLAPKPEPEQIDMRLTGKHEPDREPRPFTQEEQDRLAAEYRLDEQRVTQIVDAWEGGVSAQTPRSTDHDR